MASSTMQMLLLVLLFLCLSPSLSHASVLHFSSPLTPSPTSSSPSAPPPPPPPASSNFSIYLFNQAWLHSAPIFFRALNRTFSTADATLTLAATRTSAGTDSIGAYTATTLTWTPNPAQPTPLTWETTIRNYTLTPYPPISRGALVFTQTWVTGATGTSMGSKDGVLSAFPSFHIGGADVGEQGYVQWAGQFAWDDTKIGYWAGNGSRASLESLGVRSGPIVLFDAQGRTASMLAPLSSFMSASVVQAGDMVHVGVVGSMESIPAGWQLDTILYYEDDGVTSCVQHWGDLMLTKYGKVRSDAYDEFTVKYLGYNTDNGAYYYYNPEANQSYETTMLDVQHHWETLDLPFRFVWLDSWFYFKGANGGTKNWTAMESAFPHGLPYFHEQLRLPIIAHNRWWSAEVDYATQNGGQYSFVVEHNTSTWAVPTDQRFWDDLFFNASAWGLRVYQQDWLYNEYETVTALTTQLDLAKQWLLQMGQGASNAGISIMYCMPSPRHVLQSIEIPAVKQVRASDDYIPGNEAWHNWMVGLTSLLEWSIGLAPSKDDFWTTSSQPGSIYPGSYEPDPNLQSLSATLATGQVTPSDGIGFFDPKLIMRSVRGDGLILKADRPALYPDSVYAESAFGGDVKQPYVVETYSLHGQYVWSYILVVDVNGAAEEWKGMTVGEAMSPHLRRMAPKARGGVATHTMVVSTGLQPYPSEVRQVSLDSPLPRLAPVVDVAAPPAWALVTVSQNIQGPDGAYVSVQGELTKWVPMSAQRVREVVVDVAGVQVSLVGVQGEIVPMWYVFGNASATVGGRGQEAQAVSVYGGCVLGQVGTATFRVTFADLKSWTCGEGRVLPTPPPAPAAVDKEQEKVAAE